MPIAPVLPRTLYAEIGKLATVWANIEQDMIMHASAMAAQDTGGKPQEYLRMDFKRLREKWYSLCRQRFDTAIFNKVVHPLNTTLAQLAPERGYVIHGLWSVIGRGKYHMMYFEQKTGLASYHADFTLRQLQGITAASYRAGKELYKFSSGSHPCFKNKTATVAEIR